MHTVLDINMTPGHSFIYIFSDYCWYVCVHVSIVSNTRVQDKM